MHDDLFRGKSALKVPWSKDFTSLSQVTSITPVKTIRAIGGHAGSGSCFRKELNSLSLTWRETGHELRGEESAVETMQIAVMNGIGALFSVKYTD